MSATGPWPIEALPLSGVQLPMLSCSEAPSYPEDFTFWVGCFLSTLYMCLHVLQSWEYIQVCMYAVNAKLSDRPGKMESSVIVYCGWVWPWYWRHHHV